MSKIKSTNQNGSQLPRAKNFKMPENLTKEQKESLEVFREAMKALKEEEKIWQKNQSLILRFFPILKILAHITQKCFFILSPTVTNNIA